MVRPLTAFDRTGNRFIFVWLYSHSNDFFLNKEKKKSPKMRKKNNTPSTQLPVPSNGASRNRFQS